MKIQYQDITFQDKSATVIDQANKIITEYRGKGFDLTLRQLYYQFVARALLPNKLQAYKRLGALVNNGRLAGLIDWKSIVDRLRKHEKNSHWSNPAHIIESCAEYYAIDTRAGQDHYVEVWVEKDALSSIIEKACEPLDVSWFACRGFVSQSAMWRAANRFKEQTAECHLLHLGDLDPSGVDMTRDIGDRLGMFGAKVTVHRIALNMDQVELYKPPPNYAKVTDSRFEGYQNKYGDESWELDALEPQVLLDLIQREINNYTDKKRRNLLIDRQLRERDQLQAIANNFDDIIDQYGE